MANERHLPMRPLWGCDTCQAEWPCLSARRALRAEYHDNRVALRVYLAALMAEADVHLSQVHRNADLHRRFLAWV
ncbi:flavin reductase [Salinispora sp. H7-4]|uniref:flavin reductase n=1 Tax=Salinispora sp. H7-4 TaxID=2748321 RepID=UPI002107AF85|nr:flavin reductase [Salinispora sp. H7-4]